AFLGAMSSENAQGGTMKISSDAFAANETIPKKFTCDGPDASPKLTWSEPPAKTRSEEHTSELQSRGHLVCRLLLEKKKTKNKTIPLYKQDYRQAISINHVLFASINIIA